jgi:methyl-accepting chemotaxis protein
MSVVIVVSTAALLGTVYFVLSHTVAAQADQELAEIASKTADELDLWVSSRERDAVNLSELQPFAAACRNHKLAEAQQALVWIQRRSPFYENVFLADQDGKLFLDSIGGKSVGIDLMSIEGFRANVEHARQGAVWFGEGMKSPATVRPVALLTAPLREGNRIVGMLGTPIELADFSDSFVKNYRIRRTGFLYLADSSGMVLAHPEAARIMSWNIAKTEFGREILSRDSGPLGYEFEGVSQTARFRRAQTKPWTIVATLPNQELFASVGTVQMYLMLFGLVMLGGAVFAASYLAGKTSRLIGNAVADLENSVRQFFSASSQISSSSQSLAQSSSEQAASIEETSASAEEISAITRQNSQRSQKVAQLMNQAIPIVNTLNTAHRELATAIGEVSASGEKVSKVIKLIDTIAFQTNILALNAAVEAARAGESGLGFAVVADEVRNLAHRSALAAKETSELIEESVVKSQVSREKLGAMMASMEANNKIAAAVKAETDYIRGASQEQAAGIAQITTAISQMNQLTQTTAAHAQETASAAEELNAQSEMLNEIAGRLTVTINGR